MVSVLKVCHLKVSCSCLSLHPHSGPGFPRSPRNRRSFSSSPPGIPPPKNLSNPHLSRHETSPSTNTVPSKAVIRSPSVAYIFRTNRVIPLPEHLVRDTHTIPHRHRPFDGCADPGPILRDLGFLLLAGRALDLGSSVIP